jgi:ubiquinone/menaquinone biosynthesis C-methylase UbiE
MGMEGAVARRYAESTGKDPRRHEEQAEQVRRRLPGGGRVLEVAPGPGYTAIALARDEAYRVTGLDISETFVGIAQDNAREAAVPVDFRPGNASAMPFPDAAFDFVLCCAAFKNFADPAGALREMRRVLTPDGRALVIDLRKDVTREAVAEDVARMGLGRLDRVLTRFILGTMLARRAHTKEEFAGYLAQTSFSSYTITETPLALEVDLYAGEGGEVPAAPATDGGAQPAR